MKKIKITGGILVVILALIGAYFTMTGIIGQNSYRTNTKMVGGMDMMSPEMGMSYASPAPSRQMNTEMMAEDSLALSEGSGSSIDVSSDRRVIKNGDLNIQVEKVDAAQQKISDIAKSNGGQVFSSNIYNNVKSNLKSGTITVKVPVANFEKTLSEIKNVASLVVREATSGQDVTEEYQDLETQIRNKQAEEQSYVRILNQAQEIDDILKVTRQLSSVRGEIERLQGRLKYLASQTDMSTISISLTEDQNVTVIDSWRPFQIAKDAVNSLVKLVQGFISFLIVLVVTVIPVMILYLLAALVLYLIGRGIYRRIRRKRENKTANPSA